VSASQFHLADLFESVAAAVPERVAIEADDVTLTYADLDERSDRIAAALAQRGLKRGDTVGLYLMNCPEYLEAFIAASRLGAIPFNVNYRYSAEELSYLFDNARASAIVFNAEFESTMREVADRSKSIELMVSVGNSTSADDRAVSYGALLETSPRKDFERSEDDILLQYTGGTTGMPKGVMWPHKAFFFACLGGGGHFHPSGPISRPDEIAGRALEGYQLKMFTIAPLMHGAAIWAAWSGLLGGLTIVLDPMRTFDAEAIWDRVETYGVNIVQIVGDAMARPLRDALRDNPGRWSLGHVVNFGSGGAVFSDHLKQSIKEQLPQVNITDGMGTSEGGISGMATPSDEGMMRLPANDDQQVVVGDRFGIVGEMGLLGRSGHTPVGYFGDPEKTAEVFRTIEGRLWTLSGDQGRLEADGMITLFGRGSTCINTGGEKVFPEEVESELRAHPDIRDAVVVGRPHERWGEAVVAIVSLTDGSAKPNAGTLRTYLEGRLAGYKCPKDVIVVDEVKRSPAGKQDYSWAKALAEQAPST
jgi:fatty-acyl-CoA synthase